MKLKRNKVIGMTTVIAATVIMTLSFGLEGFLISAATAVATIAICEKCKKG